MIALSLMLCSLGQVARAAAAPTVEVVQSFPIETTLQVKGVAQTQQVWLDLVKSATRSLDIEQYYISNQPGQSLEPVLAAIKAAAGRGVSVRILLDSAFLKKNPTEADVLKGVPGIDLREVDFSPGIMHAKYLVADGVNAYTGSANMDWLALSHIHEMGLHTVDAAIGANLESIFDADWPRGTEIDGSTPASPGLAAPSAATSPELGGLKVVASPGKSNPAGVGATLDAITSLLGEARSSVDIQVYEYSTTPFSGTGSPWTPLDTAVRAAAKRGVRVRLMVDATVMNSKSKKELQSLAAVKNVQIKTIKIPKWSGGPLKYARLIHSKYLVIDQGASTWLGSENWQDSYFMETRNVGFTFQDPALGAQVQEIYNNVWSSPYGAALQ